MARRRTATTKVKSVTFMRAHGETLKNNLDPEYVHAIGSPDKDPGWWPVKSDLLRYDLGFVSEEDPTLVAFVRFSNGYGMGATVDRWKSHGFLLRDVDYRDDVEEGMTVTTDDGRWEYWNRLDLFQQCSSVESGNGRWFTFRRVAGSDGTDAGAVHRIPLAAFTAAHPDIHPQEVAWEYVRNKEMTRR